MSKADKLRISLIVRRDSMPRLKWMMDKCGASSKVDLIRAALIKYEEYLVEREVERIQKRKAAGIPEGGKF